MYRYLKAAALVGLAASLAPTQPHAQPAVPAAAVSMDVFLPLRDVAGLDRLIREQATPGSANYQKFLDPEAFARRFGPFEEIVRLATDRLRAHGMRVTARHAQSLTIEAAPSVAERMLGTPFGAVAGAGPHALGDNAALPRDLSDLGAQIADPTRRIRHHSSLRPIAGPQVRYADHNYYWFTDLRQAYDFPSVRSLDGAGATIAIVIDSPVLDSDLYGYFRHEKSRIPVVTTRPVKGGGGSGIGEATLDVEQAGGMAPGAHIMVYNVPALSDADILAGYTAVVEDNKADVVNSSFLACEVAFTAPYNNGVDRTATIGIYDNLFRQGNAQGITFVAASGDYGALGCPSPDYFGAPSGGIKGHFVRSIGTPASSPFVTAVGGTNLATGHTDGSLDSPYVGEQAFGDRLVPFDLYGTGNLATGGFWGSGGGASIFNAKPDFQTGVDTGSVKRTIPDIAMHMGGCPDIAVQPCFGGRSADALVVQGILTTAVGTSAASPDFAGVLALRRQFTHARAGNINHLLYAIGRAGDPGGAYRDPAQGFNGLYKTRKGYDLVLGWGTLDVRRFLGATALPPAGTPQTPSNP